MTRRLAFTLAALTLLPAPSVFAQEADGGTPPASLEEIERALAADAAAKASPQPEKAAAPSPAPTAQSANPDLSFTADVAAAAFSQKENLQAGAHDPTQNGFNLQQLEFTVGAAVDPYFRFDGSLVFGQSGVELEEAFATTLALPASLQVRAGQFLTRFGRFNATHPHAWEFVDQPFSMSRVFGGDGNRGLGAELSWLTPLPWYVELVGSATNPSGDASARSFLGDSGIPVESLLDLQLTAALKQFHELGEATSLLWGLSGAFGPNATAPGNRTSIFGADAYLKYRPLSQGSITVVALQAEVLYRRQETPSGTLTDLNGYGYLTYRFAQRWSTATRYELGTPAVDSAGTVGLDPLDPDWTAPRHRVSATLAFWPTEFSRLRLEGSVDLPRYKEEPIYAGFLAFEVSVGAHGAHAF